MTSTRAGAKRAVLGVVLIAAIPWTIFLSALCSAVLEKTPGVVAAIVVVVSLLAVGFVWFFPERAVAESVYAKVIEKSRGQNNRLRNVAEGLAIAIGVPAERVEVVASPVPNVLALPTRSHGLVVVATEGAIGLLSRPQLEALVASQIVVAGDKWVRLATRAQLAQAPWAFLLAATFPLGFVSPVFFVAAMAAIVLFVFTSLFRRADAVRDLVADGVAINTTKNPQALVSALRALRPSVLVAPSQKLGASGMRTDAFAVLSVRSKADTTVTVNGKSRSWATEDELATELGFRADRMERVGNGDFSALEGLGPFRKAWAALGTPENVYVLTDEERRVGQTAAAAAAGSHGA